MRRCTRDDERKSQLLFSQTSKVHLLHMYHGPARAGIKGLAERKWFSVGSLFAVILHLRNYQIIFASIIFIFLFLKNIFDYYALRRIYTRDHEWMPLKYNIYIYISNLVFLKKLNKRKSTYNYWSAFPRRWG
jgi:phosphate starvation-inducible membrane PsiE